MDNNILASLQDSIYSGDAEKSAEFTNSALSSGMEPNTILNEGLIIGMEKVGIEFRNGDLFLPEVLMAARSMKASMEILKPLLIDKGVKPVGKVLLGTVAGDIHDIGKNLVGMMLEGAGFEVVDLGTDVAPEKFIEVAEKEGCKLIGMSAMLTTTMLMMKETINKIRDNGTYDNVKIMIGGAPVTQAFAEEIGAFYSPNASEAVELAKKLVSM